MRTGGILHTCGPHSGPYALGFDATPILPAAIREVDYARLGVHLRFSQGELRISGTHGRNRKTILTVSLFGREFGVIIEPSETYRIGERIAIGSVDGTLVNVFADAQTSGGLLIAVASERCDELVDILRRNKTRCAAAIGDVGQSSKFSIVLK